MSGQHTPGPWELTSDAGHAFNARVTSPQRRHIAKVYALDTSPDPVCEANARLIAAAPALLEAVKLALGHLTGTAENGKSPHELVATYRAAIVLSSGEKP